MTRPALPTIRFSHLHRRLLYSAFALLWSSGALWLVFHYFLRTPGAFGDRAHPLETWWLRLHGLFVFSALLALGSVLPVHAALAWKRQRNRLTGLTMKSLLLWLAGTGYALYYFASEENQGWLAPLHWVVGLALPLILVFHIWRGRSRPSTMTS